MPFTEAIAIGMTREYMTDDQRFAARRPDVLVYQTDVLDKDLTLAGPLLADLHVSTIGDRCRLGREADRRLPDDVARSERQLERQRRWAATR